MDCASTRKNDYLDQSYFKSSNLVKLFDMGIKTPRAISYMLDQRLPFNLSKYGSASTPYLSLTGMVQPISSFSMNPHYNNHYSCIQAIGEHWIKKDLSCCEYDTTAVGGSANNEEEFVVEEANLFNSYTCIIDPAIISEMGEFIKGKYIMIPYVKLVKIGPVWKLHVFWKQYYLWKRTYHKFNNDNLYDSDYIYKYLFRK